MKRVLIANRGEIACRIIRALQDLKLEAVAVYSTADKDALHVQLADQNVCIGPSKATDSYLDISKILAACEIANCDAVHPGYGFLSENALFAKIVEECGLTFIGPGSSLIGLLGDKITAKKIAQEANCPVIPGSLGKVATLNEGLLLADDIGYPLLIKASAGGGGKGIREVTSKSEFEAAYKAAKLEAQISFGDDAIYLEKLIVNPKHVEVQIAGDMHGNIVHLYERDCSLQRRRQKLIEETPSPFLSDSLREEICDAALRLMKKAQYVSLGTVEFLVDKSGSFYFMEVNTRVQVEHTITEELVGVDLVEEQIQIARGRHLSFSQAELKPQGHVMEFRINAEDSELDFRPSPGVVEQVIFPLGKNVRIDTAIYPGFRISPYYDSMVAKVIVMGRNREEVLEKSKRVLKEFTVTGVKTTAPFHLKMMSDERFVENRHHILTIDSEKEEEVYT